MTAGLVVDEPVCCGVVLGAWTGAEPAWCAGDERVNGLLSALVERTWSRGMDAWEVT